MVCVGDGGLALASRTRRRRDGTALAAAGCPAFDLRPVPEPQAPPTRSALPHRRGEGLVGADEVVDKLRPREIEAGRDLPSVDQEIDIELAAHRLTVTTSGDPLGRVSVKVYSKSL